MASLRTLLPHLALMLALFTFSEARDFLVGGQENSWKVPPSPDDLNKWAGKMRFLIGDSLELKYDPKADSVLQVTEEAYKICNITNPIKTYNDGDTRIQFDRSGLFYFVSGAEGHCKNGQKLIVRVLSAKHGPKGHPPAPSPAPSPSPVGALPQAPVPTSGGLGFGGGALGVAVVLGSLAGLALV